MKLYIYTLILLSALHIGCDSSDPIQENTTTDYFIIGQYFNRCQEDCGVFYKIEDNTLYRGTTNTFTDTTEISFQQFDPKDDGVFSEFELIQKDIPRIMTDEGGTYGCPDCSDGGVLYVERHIEETTTIWLLDNITRNNPKDIVSYAEMIKTLIESLV